MHQKVQHRRRLLVEVAVHGVQCVLAYLFLSVTRHAAIHRHLRAVRIEQLGKVRAEAFYRHSSSSLEHEASNRDKLKAQIGTPDMVCEHLPCLTCLTLLQGVAKHCRRNMLCFAFTSL